MGQETLGQLGYAVATAIGGTTYHGQKLDGRLRIKENGVNYLVTGMVAERRPRTDATGQQKWSRHLIASTPSYQASVFNEKSVVAHCPTTGKSYRVTGLFKMLNPKPIVTTCQSEEGSTSIPYQSQIDKPKHPLTAKIVGGIQRTQAAFQREFEVIAAQRAAGLDPDLRMSFISVFLNESKANLYRKMGKGFPPPIKRGKGSFWPMSQIEAYKAGQLLGVVA